MVYRRRRRGFRRRRLRRRMRPRFKRKVKRIVNSMAETKFKPYSSHSIQSGSTYVGDVHLPVPLPIPGHGLSFVDNAGTLEYHGISLNSFMQTDPDDPHIPIQNIAADLTAQGYNPLVDIGPFGYGIGGGTARSNRVGHDIQLRGLRMNAVVAPSASDGNNTVRLSIVMNKMRQDIKTTDLPQAFTANYDPDKFKVIWDRRFTLNKLSASHADIPIEGPGVQKKHFRKYFKLNRKMKFDNMQSRLDDIMFPKIYFFAWSDSQVDPHPTIDASFYFYFKDI